MVPELSGWRDFKLLQTKDKAFVDVSGFTNLATRLDVDVLQRHINRYFSRLLDVCGARGGDVLRFMGDAILVTWALPLGPAADAVPPPRDAGAAAVADGVVADGSYADARQHMPSPFAGILSPVPTSVTKCSPTGRAIGTMSSGTGGVSGET